MQLILLLSAFVAATYAIVCPPNACDGVQQAPLNCAGNVLKGSGFCGCTDSCAKVEGEQCRSSSLFLLGAPNTERCDHGLVCKTVDLEGHVQSVCVKESMLTDGDEVLASKKRSSLIVCPPNVCDNVVKPDLSCNGGVIRNTGYCGCYDVCAKTEGEECSLPIMNLMGVPNTQQCDAGLECRTLNLEGHVSTRCVDPSKLSSNEVLASKRAVSLCDTPCRRKSQMCTFSFVIYPGQWFANCDLDGNFLSQQCDNQKECFCVDKYTGTIDEDTRVLGSANCV